MYVAFMMEKKPMIIFAFMSEWKLIFDAFLGKRKSMYVVSKKKGFQGFCSCHGRVKVENNYFHS